MSKTWKWIIVAVAAILIGTVVAVVLIKRPEPSDTAASPVKHTGFELFQYVPSDASAVISYNKLSEGLEDVFDFQSPYRDLRLGDLASEKVAISMHFAGRMIPMVAVYAGKQSSEPSSAVTALCQEAERAGLKTLFIPGETRKDRNVLLVSELESILYSAKRHFEEHSSVFNADGISEALSSVSGKNNVVLVRNESVKDLVPSDFLSKLYKRKDVVDFLKNYAAWTVLTRKSSEMVGKGTLSKYEVRAVGHSDFSHLCNVLGSQSVSESELQYMIPVGTQYIVDLPLADVETFIEARKKYLDSRGGLNNYNNNLAKLSKKSKVNPEEWLKSINVKEVARISWKGESVILVRPEEASLAHNIKANKYSGMIPLVFGKSFEIGNDSMCACIGHWLIFGSDKSVKHYIESNKDQKNMYGMEKSSKLFFTADNVSAVWTRTGLELDIYKNF